MNEGNEKMRPSMASMNGKGKMPELAIVESNTLAMMGLKQLLETAMPFANIKSFGTLAEFKASLPEQFMHYFVSMQIVLSDRSYFLDKKHKTIVLTPSNDPMSQLGDFHCLCVNVSEGMLIQQLMNLQKLGHPHGEHLPKMEAPTPEKLLSDREIEVLSLVAQGKINKEIADQLCIGLTTVITHRKNIQEKLGIKSVSALTIYAVMHGYVDINRI